jgi:hypothetical protein
MNRAHCSQSRRDIFDHSVPTFLNGAWRLVGIAGGTADCELHSGLKLLSSLLVWGSAVTVVID